MGLHVNLWNLGCHDLFDVFSDSGNNPHVYLCLNNCSYALCFRLYQKLGQIKCFASFIFFIF